jgi:hypothetical protein
MISLKRKSGVSADVTSVEGNGSISINLTVYWKKWSRNMLTEANVTYTFNEEVAEQYNMYGLFYTRHFEGRSHRVTEEMPIYILADSISRAKSGLLELCNLWNKRSREWKFTV